MGRISGIIEKNEEPLQRAKIEIFEEVGIPEDEITLLKAGLKKLELIHHNTKIMNGKFFHFCLNQKIQRSNSIGKIQILNGLMLMN